MSWTACVVSIRMPRHQLAGVQALVKELTRAAPDGLSTVGILRYAGPGRFLRRFT